MAEIFQRLQAALPQMLIWVDRLLEENAASATRLDLLGFSRLPFYWPVAVLRRARVVVISGALPFPPVSEYGLPEFAAMGEMPMAGITFRDMFFVERSAETSEATHFHELVHTIQWNALGPSDFLLTYGVGLVQFGYENSPLEAIAYELQSKFERDELIPDIADNIERHTFQAFKDACEVLAR